MPLHRAICLQLALFISCCTDGRPAARAADAGGGPARTDRHGDPLPPGAVSRLEGHSGAVKDLAWSPDGARLASVSWEDGTVRLWERAAGKPLLRFPCPWGP
jgi:WD40 repeat protein